MDARTFFGDSVTDVKQQEDASAVEEKEFGAIAVAQYQEALELIARMFRDDPKLIALAQIDLPVRQAYKTIGIHIPAIKGHFLAR